MNVKKEKRCALNPLPARSGLARAADEHLRPRRIANDSEPSAASYRRIRGVPMVRRTERRRPSR
jgi:hypothetical protein